MEANENSGERKIKRFNETKTAASEKSSDSTKRKRRRAKNRAIQGERAPSSLPRPSSFFPRWPAARRTDPLTEGLEKARVWTTEYFPSVFFLGGGGGGGGGTGWVAILVVTNLRSGVLFFGGARKKNT